MRRGSPSKYHRPQFSAIRRKHPSSADPGSDAAAKGFTLIEVVVALAVLAVVLVSVFRMQAANLDAVRHLDFNSRAAMLAQAKIADLDARGFEEDFALEGDFGEDAPGYGWQVTMSERDDELLGETARRLKIIDIRIDLNHDERVFYLRTQRLAPP